MITLVLLFIMGIVFILQSLFPQLTTMFYFDPSRAISDPWLFITSIFLHGGLLHLFFNAYALFLFGPILERKIKQNKFLILFFGAGIIGGITYYESILLGLTPMIPALGASGAIFGILGAVVILLPEMRIFLWFFPMKMKHAAIIWILFELYGSFNMAGSGIASIAHLGGLFFGMLFAYFLIKSNGKINIKKVDNFYLDY